MVDGSVSRLHRPGGVQPAGNAIPIPLTQYTVIPVEIVPGRALDAEGLAALEEKLNALGGEGFTCTGIVQARGEAAALVILGRTVGIKAVPL